jgi:hypothetical protein
VRNDAAVVGLSSARTDAGTYSQSAEEIILAIIARQVMTET